MPTSFKNRKKRDSHQKHSDDSSSVASQRSPSSASHMSADSPRQNASLAEKTSNSPFLGQTAHDAQKQPPKQQSQQLQQLKQQPNQQPNQQQQQQQPPHQEPPQPPPQPPQQTPQMPAQAAVGASPASAASAASPAFPGASDTPWAEYAIQRAAPSPRFGHSANYLAARDGELFIMGGIRDMDILNDLWVIDTKTSTGYQLVTDGYKVGPRVGHAALVLGNAHVVFGGDTKIDESDPLDDNLYSSNTSSLKWTVAQPQGPRPCGRYGHSSSNVGARVYVFGGQVDEEFYDDMWAFDLTTWRAPTAKWELVKPATPPPPPRTNHTVVTHEDKSYSFGGANGDSWYSDTWCFDPVTRAWEQLECSGYVPAPCQGHAATIIGDVMYVFGGMSSQGSSIDQLFASKLSTLKWYTFQNLGPGPSPRSGHSLTAFGGDKVLVWGGTDQGNSAYVSDVSRINYPDDQPANEADPESAAGSVVNTPAMYPAETAHKTQETPETQDTTQERNTESNTESKEANRETRETRENIESKETTREGTAREGKARDSKEDVPSVAAATSPSRDAPSPPTPSARTSGPITTKEVRESQPHVYAPQSSETSGPTQAKSNSAARNSMSFSKRRSVLMPSSPTKAFDKPREAEPPQPGETRSPHRETAQVRSYVTEHDGESADERFVSAVDLRDDSADAPKIRAHGHARGLSFGINPAVPEEPERANTSTAENSDQFRKLEDESHGMPGGFTSPQKERGPDLASVHSDESVKSGRNGWNSDHDGESGAAGSLGAAGTSLGAVAAAAGVGNTANANKPGSRRSQPQTNSSIHSIEDENASGEGTGVIGSSDEMSAPSNKADAQLYRAAENVHRADDASQSQSSQSSQNTNQIANQHNSSHAGNDNSRSHNLHTDSVHTDSLHSTNLQGDHTADLTRSADRSDHTVDPTPAHASSPKDHKLASLGSTQPSSSTHLPRESHPEKDLPAQDHSGQDHSYDTSSDFKGVYGQNDQHADAAKEYGDTAKEYDAQSEKYEGPAAEIAASRRQLNAYRQRDFNDEHHQLQQSHAQQQRELTSLRDANAQLTRKHTAVLAQNADLKQRHDHMAGVLDGHVGTSQQQQQALDEANRQLAAQQAALTQSSVSQSENADLKLKLKTAEANERHAQEQLDASNSSYASSKSAHSDLSARHLVASGSANKDKDGAGSPEAHSQLSHNVFHLVSMWEGFKSPRSAGSAASRASAGSAGTGSAESGRDIGASNTEDFKQLYETQKEAAKRAQAESQRAYAQQSDMKAQLRELSASYAHSHSDADLDASKQQHHTALTSLDAQHRATSRDSHDHASSLEDSRTRLARLESAHRDLQSEYTKAIDSSRNQQAALTKTREELNMSRAHNQRLEEQLEDASSQNSSAHGNATGDTTAGDSSHASINSGRNDQAALVIRDSRAQIVILEEEVKEQRQQVMTLKKQALTKSQS